MMDVTFNVKKLELMVILHIYTLFINNIIKLKWRLKLLPNRPKNHTKVNLYLMKMDVMILHNFYKNMEILFLSLCLNQ